MKKILIILISISAINLLAIVLFLGYIKYEETYALRMETYHNGAFSLLTPPNWEMTTAGECGSLSFLLTNPQKPLTKVFYIGEVGPVYINSYEKKMDEYYRFTLLAGMPVINPFTPKIFLRKFHLIAKTNLAKSFMLNFPEFSNIRVIKSVSLKSNMREGQASIIRATFRENGQIAEGIFIIDIAPFMPARYNSGYGTGIASTFAGLTAPKEEFESINPKLAKILESFTINPQYVSLCLKNTPNGENKMTSGKVLNGVSDLIMQTYENRNKSFEAVSDKWNNYIKE